MINSELSLTSSFVPVNSLPRGKIYLAIEQACNYWVLYYTDLNRGEIKLFTDFPVLCCILYLWFYVISSLLYAVSIRMKNTNECAISLLLVCLYIDWNLISYTFTFSSSLLSSIKFVPSSKRYKLQNRLQEPCFCFVLGFFSCDFSIKPIKQCFYNVFITLW